MKPINLPPFYVGQRVVCIDDDNACLIESRTPSGLKKNKEYVVGEIVIGCCSWVVSVGIKNMSNNKRCGICGSVYNKGSEDWLFRASRFAPITENFQSISYEKVMEEESKLISVN